MWRFVSAEEGQGLAAGPHLRSTNEHQGRQIWVFDKDAGTTDERAKVEQLRKNFADNRHTQRHSSDELLRLQCSSKLAKKAFAPPKGPVPQSPDASRVAEHLKGAIGFYECLQQDDGHWPGDYGGEWSSVHTSMSEVMTFSAAHSCSARAATQAPCSCSRAS